ncbi:arsenate reductase ArsC [Lysobacter sp. FW306-1B-D06B]|uniref:arsenate reductase ArsC n=1 Tax=Lysobacter sp. FW306-1B-D06B TaxID=3140250 RepID=UPI003140668C
MNKPAYNALFLCTGNSARSQMAEALLNMMSDGRFRAYSAGSHPSGFVKPHALELIQSVGYPTDSLRSKSWDEFTGPDAPRMDLVITVCDNAAGETCPIWPGHPAVAHWGVPDPVDGDPYSFKAAWWILRRRVELLLALPMEKLDRLAREQRLNQIAETTQPTETSQA